MLSYHTDNKAQIISIVMVFILNKIKMHLKYKTNYLSARNARTVYNIFPIFL